MFTIMKKLSILSLWLSLLLILAGTVRGEEFKYEVEAALPEAGFYFNYEDGFVNLRVKDAHWIVVFLDKDKKIIDPTWNSMIIRWEEFPNSKVKKNSGFVKAAGPYFQSTVKVFPIYKYKATLTFLTPDGKAKQAFPEKLLLPGLVKE